MRLSAFAILALPAALLSAQESWKSQGVIHNVASPYAKLHSVPVRAVKMGDGFWTPRMRINVERSIPTLLELLEQHGIVDNFRRLSGKKAAIRKGPLYTDSDLYKWMEATAFVLQSGDDPKLRSTIDRLTEEIRSAQEPSGYLNTYYIEDRVPLRFTQMQGSHELYCLGHLLQAGLAYFRATGNRNLLDVGARFADYLVENFGPQKRPALTGHPELEMAMVELYRTTGNRRYLDFAGYLLSGVERERLKLTPRDLKYLFSGKPFTSRTGFEGHAVRAMYASCGAADYYAETGDAAYRKTLDVLWEDLWKRKSYVTGGVGSRAEGEAFGEPYELPNAQAYTESCAAIGNFMWCWRMLSITGEAQFADMMERALYNGINSGMSLDGTLYCYRNPLESSGEKIRNPWYDTTCCPPNLERTFAALPGYLYNTSKAGVYINFYHASEMDWHLEDGTPLKLTMKTGYPWKGAVELTVNPAAVKEFSIFLRSPEWAPAGKVEVKSLSASPAKMQSSGGYLELRAVWSPGTRLVFNLDVAPRLILANPRIRENTGRVAVVRGPLVYCLEQPDNPDAGSVLDVALDPGGKFIEEYRAELLGGVTLLRHPGLAPGQPYSEAPLYSTQSRSLPQTRRTSLTLIPYYAWANRGQANMQVWIAHGATGAR